MSKYPVTNIISLSVQAQSLISQLQAEAYKEEAESIFLESRIRQYLKCIKLGRVRLQDLEKTISEDLARLEELRTR